MPLCFHSIVNLLWCGNYLRCGVCNIMIMCTMLYGECAAISDRHMQSSCRGVQDITFGDEDGCLDVNKDDFDCYVE